MPASLETATLLRPLAARESQSQREALRPRSVRRSLDMQCTRGDLVIDLAARGDSYFTQTTTALVYHCAARKRSRLPA